MIAIITIGYSHFAVPVAKLSDTLSLLNFPRVESYYNTEENRYVWTTSEASNLPDVVLIEALGPKQPQEADE
jgi:hypothetical protein